MTSCPLTPHPRSPRFRSAVEVAEGLAHLVLVVHRDPLGPRVTQALPDLRAKLVNVDLLDQKAPGVFRVPPDPLVVELEEPRFLVPRGLGVLLALPDLRATTVFQGLLDPLVLPERTDNQDPRVMLVLLALPDLRVRLDLLESVVPPVRMQSPLSLTSISPRTRQPRPTARRLMSKMHFDRLIPSRMALGITRR